MFLSDFWGFSRMSFMTLACLLVRRLLWMEFEVFECSFLVSSIIILFFKSVGSWWDGLISKVLLYEHEDLSSNHWHPCKNRAQHTYNLSAEVERQGEPQALLTGQCRGQRPIQDVFLFALYPRFWNEVFHRFVRLAGQWAAVILLSLPP